MDIKLMRMRDDLAVKAMGWHYQEPCRKWPVDEPVYLHGDTGKWGACHIFVADWKPDKDPVHMMWLIEAIWKEKFVLHMSVAIVDGEPWAFATCSRFDPEIVEHLFGQSRTEDGGMALAVCEAIYQALEPSNG